MISTITISVITVVITKLITNTMEGIRPTASAIASALRIVGGHRSRAID